ncbi:cryptochrome/photolyase family protein [Variovorax arabinosiphilus]|uniref:cryptochrome/photolyase family protein n=1 Tax=Variovorax arabinosiphilus TaxID=3053498 RepID=UPI002576B242|nr:MULTISPECIES: deoxyribodipyrimidine photo-lyase [unclassified Variovorax]MDM0120826.1 deoxyribodipyrimidine photo-lyase [Variovorax sp. J2L1-78]MDM0127262.1 deoxyribodipyrimidine photo-lyase [Variovorax sp. J2L1-63]MDM0236206.1 deoxyribodipyrimidine photo-lyase [Variovorax sp. J2R1-6]
MPPILLAVDKTYPKGLMWFRRDLRVDDNAALWRALRTCREVVCVFVFDKAILDSLPRADRRVEFIRESLVELDAELRALGGGLIVRHALAEDEIPELAHALDVQAVFANRDDEPAAIARDAKVFGALANAGITFHTAKDQVVFERDEVLTKVGQPYTVFTPYKRAWLAKLDDFFLKPYPSRGYAESLIAPPARYDAPVPALQDIGFEATNLSTLEIPTGAQGGATLFEDFFDRIDRYDAARNFPAVRGPSYLSVHLRFGTVSIRQLASVAHQLSLQGNAGAATWLSELIWRDFYFQILAHNPHLAEGKSFRPEYDKIIWHHGKHADMLFDAWCQGRTGYPLIDAAMAQINQSGYMHNRLRMVVASFLCKDLGLDWRRGEAYFALHLNDFELSSNNGGWQWASSSGCDAQPYFRIFNPVTQSERFDPEGKFIRRYLPQLASLSNKVIHAPWTASPVELEAAGLTLGEQYPKPIVDHAEARDRTLQRYGVVRKVATGH